MLEKYSSNKRKKQKIWKQKLGSDSKVKKVQNQKFQRKNMNNKNI